MSGKVFVTGTGIISAIGKNTGETLDSLVNLRTGIGKINHLDTIHKNEFVAGEVNYSLKDLQMLAGSSENYNRTTLLGLIAAKEALQNAGITNINSCRTGIISSTTVGGMCHTELLYKAFLENKTNENFISKHFCGISTDDIANELGITEFVTTISTACSSAANAIMLGARMIKNKKLDRVIVGGTDALCKFTLNGFNTLMILDKEWCKPFDQNRRGLNLGEGAAYLVLESEEIFKKENKKAIAVLSGYGNANDAFHQTASSAEGLGAFLAMQQAFSVAKISPAQISYVNAHGTGTENNDLSEGVALKKVFSDNVPAFSSTKAYTGHTLAAAAGIEAVISVLALQHGYIFPCLNWRTSISGLDMTPVTELRKENTANHVLSNSFGFGGNCSALIFSKN
ncbi:MAG: beta-ketoacyl-[acyl-carrier-protein] synthase family protein [Bacteroidia bacterium]